MQANLETVELPVYTEEEMEFANAISDTLAKKADIVDNFSFKLPSDKAAWLRQQDVYPYANFVIPRIYGDGALPGSSDVGDVSWVCPTAQVLAATWPTGVPAHSWQAVAVGKSSAAHKSMLYAGKVIAGTAIDMIENPELIEKAKAEHVSRVGSEPFVSPIPKDVKPQAIGMKK